MLPATVAASCHGVTAVQLTSVSLYVVRRQARKVAGVADLLAAGELVERAATEVEARFLPLPTVTASGSPGVLHRDRVGAVAEFHGVVRPVPQHDRVPTLPAVTLLAEPSPSVIRLLPFPRRERCSVPLPATITSIVFLSMIVSLPLPMTTQSLP